MKQSRYSALTVDTMIFKMRKENFMKFFVEPEIEIRNMVVSDVITTSGDGTWGDDVRDQ